MSLQERNTYSGDEQWLFLKIDFLEVSPLWGIVCRNSMAVGDVVND